MGIFTTEKKLYINPETKKAEWITTKRGLLDRESRTPTYDKLKPQIKKIQQEERKKKWEKRQKTYNSVAKTVNNALDLIEGSNTTKKQSKPVHKAKNKYVVKNGVAYPVYRPKKINQNKKKKKTKDPFDFEIKW